MSYARFSATGIRNPQTPRFSKRRFSAEKFRVSKIRLTEHNSHLRLKASILTSAFFLTALAVLAGCGKDLDQQSDAELGLNPQQAQGRHVYRMYCAQCHSAYTSKGMKGPSLKGLYKKEYLPSGLLANDQFVEQAIVRGRKMMPPTSLTKEQLDDLMVYLHTL